MALAAAFVGSSITARKVCFACHRDLPVTAYHTKRSSKDGYAARCIPCAREYMIRWRSDHPEAARQLSARWRKKNPKYALEWQHANSESHNRANREYRNRVMAQEKPSLDIKKTCDGCAESKRLCEFGRASAMLDGRTSLCLLCTAKRKRFRFYGMTPERFEAMWHEQNGLCAICLDPLIEVGKKGVVIDHCHQSGKIRELLCNRCNCALGHLHDDPVRCERAGQYLLKHQQAQA